VNTLRYFSGWIRWTLEFPLNWQTIAPRFDFKGEFPHTCCVYDAMKVLSLHSMLFCRFAVSILIRIVDDLFC
jgi:hypothetical protein